LRIVLIALAIQGITPDGNDLASINTLKLLCPSLIDADQMLDEDEFPDDVCEPVQRGIDSGRCQRTDRNELVYAGAAAAESQLGTTRSGSPPFAARRAMLNRMGALIDSLCRLNC
jgi:hypothetical protein